MLRSLALAFAMPAVAVVSVALLSGCGGKVVFVEDDDGSGGSGAGGAGPGPGPGPNTTNVSTSTGVATICQQFCSVYGACVEDDCNSTCEGLFTGQCDPEVNTLLTCFTAQNGNCDTLESSCFAELSAFTSCQNQSPCFEVSCNQDPGGCYCTGICFDDQQLDQTCYTVDGGQPGGPGTCDCYLNGEYFGSCDSFGSECSIEGECCQYLVGGFK